MVMVLSPTWARTRLFGMGWGLVQLKAVKKTVMTQDRARIMKN
jgi:hypothetical protein